MDTDTIDPDDPRPINQLKRRIAAGIWEDQLGNYHWSVPEMMKLVELDDTPANRAACIKILKETLAKLPNTKTIFRESPDDPGKPI